jgi:hypothetical protein
MVFVVEVELNSQAVTQEDCEIGFFDSNNAPMIANLVNANSTATNGEASAFTFATSSNGGLVNANTRGAGAWVHKYRVQFDVPDLKNGNVVKIKRKHAVGIKQMVFKVIPDPSGSVSQPTADQLKQAEFAVPLSGLDA